MITVLNLFVTLVLAVSSPAPVPASTPGVTAAANNCWCQTMPMKDWGK